ncbi:InlB B-repeat-containing protein [Arabiibacter massiliensis]|uniref:InlB B-repeat-containing protein n=1 Tax=Arabiibacter massiliensis TaxID=1870985 RepID=UPI0009BC5840|nr:InlB B-repeat-containing protein [Arabiibacter massiliensis]
MLVFLMTAAMAALCAPAIALGDEPAAGNGVAQAGGVEYATLQEAIDAAQPGEKVTVLQDVEENVVVGAGTDVVLDLNGKIVAGAADADGTYRRDTVVVEGALTVRDATAPSFGPVVDEDYGDIYPYASGKILGKAPTAEPCAKALRVRNGGSAVIESGIVESEGGDAALVNAGSSLEVGRAYVHGSQRGVGVEGEGATFKAGGCVIISEDGAAVGGSGTEGAEYGGTSIAIDGGALISHSKTDGYLACGIYHPQRGTLDVSSCTVYSHGGVGILMRGGTLNMTGGTVVTTGDAGGKVGDGATVVDACYNVVVDGACGYYDSANARASLSGGLFVSEGGATPPPLCQMGAEGRLVVTGGTFDADVSAFFDGSIYSQNPQGALEDSGAVVPRVYGIAYDLAGGTLPDGADNPAAYTYFDGPITLANPTRTGYVFAGWTGTGLAGAAAQAVIPANSTGDRSYTATWDPEPGTRVDPDASTGEDPHAQDRPEAKRLAKTGDGSGTAVGTLACIAALAGAGAAVAAVRGRRRER